MCHVCNHVPQAVLVSLGLQLMSVKAACRSAAMCCLKAVADFTKVTVSEVSLCTDLLNIEETERSFVQAFVCLCVRVLA